MNFKLVLALILLIAALTRLLFLGQFPNGFTGDEAQQGYSAYSILKTGKDEWGQTLPLFPRGFGDFKPPLYTYLAIPSIGLFGLTVEAVRLPAAIVGIFAVFALYFLVKEFLKDGKIALWSSFLLAISPWHIQISRTAWEGGLGILTFSLGLLFYLKSGLKNYILAAFFWGLTLYTYHSFRLFVILFILGLLLLSWKKLLVKNNLTPIIIFLIFLLPLLININSTLARSSDVGIYSQREISGYFANKSHTPLPPILDRIMDNKFLFVINNFSNNFFSYFSPTFYFSGNRSDNTYLNFPFFPLLYQVELLFWLFAVYYLTKYTSKKNILILWFLLAAVPASLAVGSMNANRVPTLLPLVSIISALGIRFLMEKVKVLKFFILPLFFLFFVLFLNFYFIKLPQKPPDNLRFGYNQVFKKILELEKDYEQVVISKTFTEPQIFIAFYNKMDPGNFQKASQDWLRYEKANKNYVDQLESYNLGKFLFEDISWDKKDSLRKNALVVSKAEDFPMGVESILDVIDNKGKVIYRLVPVNYEKTQGTN